MAIMYEDISTFIKTFMESPDSIMIVNNQDIQPTFALHRSTAIQKFGTTNVHCLEPKTMLSLDMGTGFYLAQISDVQKEYSQVRETFYVGLDNKRIQVQKKMPS